MARDKWRCNFSPGHPLYLGRRCETRDDGFHEWAAATTPQLVRTATLLTGDLQLGEDLVQNTLMRVWRKWPQVRDGHPDAYARTIMRRLQGSAVRRKWRGEIPTEVLPERLTGQPDPSDNLALRQALMQLPLGMRTMLVLRYVEDLPITDVARICDCSEGNVKSQCARGQAKLRALMSEGEGR